MDLKISRLYLLLLPFSLFFGCDNKEETEYSNSDQNSVEKQEPLIIQSNNDMAVELQRLAQNCSAEINIYLNSARSNFYQSKVQSGENRIFNSDWFNYCTELMRAGNSRKAIEEISTYFDPLIPIQQQIKSADDTYVVELLALANLRLGEQENCQNNHTEFSCIIPLQEPAYHQLKEGSSSAIELYEMLYDNEAKPYYKWLINLAHMTLGQYPDGVNEKYKLEIPNWKLEQEDFPRFKEIAMNVNLAQNGLSGGVCIEDFNKDGLLDVFSTDFGLTASPHFMINNGKGSFEDQTTAAQINNIVGGLNCIQADYDNDGWIDILVLRGAWLESVGNFPNSLLKNNGDGTFTDVTKKAGIISYHPTQTAAWGDFNRDGYLDLFIGNETTEAAVHPCELYQNNGDGTFKEISKEVGLGTITKFVKGVAFGDIDNDNYPELYLSVLGDKNLLFKNNAGQFENISEQAGIEEPIESFPCWFWDVNNDGFLDIFVGGYDMSYPNVVPDVYAQELAGKTSTISTPRLYINKGNNTFVEQHKQYNINRAMYPMGCNFGDLDNDGFLDFYLGTGCPDYSAVIPNRMFRNMNGKRFEEVTSAGGFGHIQKGHGVAFADIDMDGDQDIYAVMGGAYDGDLFTNVLFENPGFGNNWIVLELTGIKTNKSAIGTRMALDLSDGRTIYHTVGSGGSFGASSLQCELGLGKAEQIEKLTIYWQNSTTQIIENIVVNQKIKIVEEEGNYQKESYTSVPFSTVSKGHHHH